MGRRGLWRGLAVAAAAAVTMPGAPVGAEDTGGKPYRLQLSGSEEFNSDGVPINVHGDADRGSVVLTLNQGQERVCWTFGPITLTAGEALPQAAHIHLGPAGRGGPVAVGLFGTATTGPAPASYPTGTTCVDAGAGLVKAMRHHPDRYYVNLHNAQHPAGVMRAQLDQ